MIEQLNVNIAHIFSPTLLLYTYFNVPMSVYGSMIAAKANKYFCSSVIFPVVDNQMYMHTHNEILI